MRRRHEDNNDGSVWDNTMAATFLHQHNDDNVMRMADAMVKVSTSMMRRLPEARRVMVGW